MLPLNSELFEQQFMQDPVFITHALSSSKNYDITIMSYCNLTEEQIDVIISVVETDIAARYKPFDIAIDIVAYSGICKHVNVIKTSKSVKVIIG